MIFLVYRNTQVFPEIGCDNVVVFTALLIATIRHHTELQQSIWPMRGSVVGRQNDAQGLVERDVLVYVNCETQLKQES